MLFPHMILLPEGAVIAQLDDRPTKTSIVFQFCIVFRRASRGEPASAAMNRTAARRQYWRSKVERGRGKPDESHGCGGVLTKARPRVVL